VGVKQNFLIKQGEKIKMGKEKVSKSLQAVKAEVEQKFVDEKLSAREILIILRELENDAMLALLYGQIAMQQTVNDVKKAV